MSKRLVMSRLPGAENVVVIPTGSEEHEGLLRVGYQMTKDEAEILVKRWTEDPQSIPFEQYQLATAFLASLNTAPEPVSTVPGWKRSQRR